MEFAAAAFTATNNYYNAVMGTITDKLKPALTEDAPTGEAETSTLSFGEWCRRSEVVDVPASKKIERRGRDTVEIDIMVNNVAI